VQKKLLKSSLRHRRKAIKELNHAKRLSLKVDAIERAASPVDPNAVKGAGEGGAASGAVGAVDNDSQSEIEHLKSRIRSLEERARHNDKLADLLKEKSHKSLENKLRFQKLEGLAKEDAEKNLKLFKYWEGKYKSTFRKGIHHHHKKLLNLRKWIKWT